MATTSTFESRLHSEFKKLSKHLSTQAAQTAGKTSWVREFRKAIGRDLPQLDHLRDELTASGRFGEAAKLPDQESLGADLTALEKAVSAGDRETAAAVSQRVTKSLKAAADARRALAKKQSRQNALARQSADKKWTDVWMKLGSGMMEKHLQKKEFITALADRGVLIAAAARPVNLPTLPLFAQTDLIKPGRRAEDAPAREIRNAEADFIEKYGKVSDLPLTIVAPLAAANLFQISLDAADFLSGRPVDATSPIGSVGVDYIALLKDFASRHGSVRYAYGFSSALFNRTQPDDDSYGGALPTVGTVRRELFNIMSNHLLFSQKNQMEASLPISAVAEIFDFRSRVLNWGSFSNQVWTRNYNATSAYPPEQLDNILFTSHYLPSASESRWLGQVKETITRATAAMQSETSAAVSHLQSVSNGDLDILEKAAQLLRYFYFGAASDKAPKTLSLPMQGVFVFSMPTASFDYEFVNRFLADPNPLYSSGKEDLLGLLDALLTAIRGIEAVDPDWYLLKSWSYRPCYLQFLEALRLQASQSVEVSIASRIKVDQLLSNIRTRFVGRIKAYMDLQAEISAGVFYAEWVKDISGILTAACRPLRVITQAYLPLVMSPDAPSLKSPLVSERFRLDPVDVARAADFFICKPAVGLLKEYRLELKHNGFGLGNHLYSQTLFPGETVQLEMRSRQRFKETATTSTAENIFEEASAETLQDLSNELRQQLQRENKSSKTSEREIGGGFGAELLGIINIAADAHGKWSSLDEERNFADSLQSVLSKLSTKLSQKRQVTFDIKNETVSETETENESKSTRSYANLNKEKNLTINFFQITRQYKTELSLDDAKVFYTSGRYPILKIFVPGVLNETEARRVLGVNPHFSKLKDEAGLDVQTLFSLKVIEPLPVELWDLYPQDVLVVITAPPYQARIQTGNTNAFLISNLTKARAREINEQIWRMLGGGQASPEGLAVSAFPFGKEEAPERWPMNPKTGKAWEAQAPIGDSRVCADKIQIQGDALTYFLPNLDLRYKGDSAISARYRDDDAAGPYSLPKRIWSRTYVVNTNGVYAENMLGQCSALEDYATRHRELDVRQKEIQIDRDRTTLEKDRLDLRKIKALTPPLPEDYAQGGFSDAQSAYERLRAAENTGDYNIRTSGNASVNVNLDLDKTAAGMHVNIVSEDMPT